MTGKDTAGRPWSKRDRSLPCTYEAWVDILAGGGREPEWDHYFSDTLCGLIECLDEQGIGPAHVRLFGVYRKEQTPLDTGVLVDADGRWLARPDLCHALEVHYAVTREECYRGHVEKGTCAFADRDRDGDGPVW
jgi:hypothetical protein